MAKNWRKWTDEKLARKFKFPHRVKLLLDLGIEMRHIREWELDWRYMSPLAVLVVVNALLRVRTDESHQKRRTKSGRFVVTAEGCRAYAELERAASVCSMWPILPLLPDGIRPRSETQKTFQPGNRGEMAQ